jgi:tRNA(adenine34) deaminase
LETDLAMMRRALLAAEEAAEKGEVPVGAVIARGEDILAVAANEREATGDPTAHAELLAIRRASAATGGWRLTGCTLYATLEPCPMCAGAAHASRLSRLVFAAPDPKAGYAGTLHNTPADARLIIPSSSKAAFSKKEPPHYSATSSNIVAGDPEKPPKPPYCRTDNILYNVLNLEVNSS